MSSRLEHTSRLEESEYLVARMITRFAENGVLSEEVSTGTFFENPTQNDVTAFVEAVRWLQAEGLIRTSAMPAIVGQPVDIPVRVVLTSDGFALLGRKLGSGESIGSAVKNASDGRGYSNAGELIGGILGAFTKSISS